VFFGKTFFPTSDKKKNKGWDKGKENPSGGNKKNHRSELPPLLNPTFAVCKRIPLRGLNLIYQITL
jgi:hypothetical protein